MDCETVLQKDPKATKSMVRILKCFASIPQDQVDVDKVIRVIFVGSRMIANEVEKKDFEETAKKLTDKFFIFGTEQLVVSQK